METKKALLAEQKLNKIAHYAPYIHCVGFVVLIGLGVLKPNNSSEIIQSFALAFLLLTFVINRTYIYAGKDVEKYKKFSEQEVKERKKEYFIKFFIPIFFWTGCIILKSG